MNVQHAVRDLVLGGRRSTKGQLGKRRCSALKTRVLRAEALEERALLSLSEPFYFADGQRIALEVQTQQYAVKLNGSGAAEQLANLTQPGNLLAGLEAGQRVADNVFMLRGDGKALAGLHSANVAWTTPAFVAPSGNTVLVLDEAIVAIKPGVAPGEVLGTGAVSYRPLLGTPDQFVVTLAGAGMQTLEYVEQMRLDPRVAWASPNLFQSMQRMAVPNDPLFPTQWHLNNTGSNSGIAGATAGADVNAVAAWNLSTGSGVTIAVLDDGIERTHPDLAANIFVNPGEIASNGIDDDGNGWVDDVSGWSFATGGPDPTQQSGNEHGTSVAGIAAGRGNNSLGIVGAAFNAKILPVQVFDGGTFVGEANAASAVYYAAGRTADGLGTWNAAQVINCSWGGGAPNTALTNAFAWASGAARGGKGVPTFISSGNNYRASLSYPAVLSGSLSGVIAVGASNDIDVRSDYSNYGPELDFVASSSDGARIASDTLATTTTDRTGALGYNPAGDYTTNQGATGFGGTSSASPLAAGVGALMLSFDSALTAAQVKQTLRATADKVGGVVYNGAGFNLEYGYGRIDAYAAIRSLHMLVDATLPAANAVVLAPPAITGGYRVDFSAPFSQLAGDIVASRFKVNGSSAIGYTVIDANTLQFNFAVDPVVGQGPQQITLAAGTVKRAADGDPLRAYSGSFYYDTAPLQVTGTVPPTNSAITLPITTIDLTFSEPLGPSSVQAGDFALNQGTVVSAVPLDATTIRLTLSGVANEGGLFLSIAAGALTDVYNNPGDPYNGNWSTDFSVRAFPTPLAGQTPAGSLVYGSSISGWITPAADTDAFTLAVDGGQTVSLVVAPTFGGLRPAVDLYDPSNNLLASTTAATAGAKAVINSVAVPAGTCRAVVRGVAGTGAYTLSLTLNAALEREGLLAGAADDAIATAQDLDPAFINIGETARRAAAVGTALTVGDGFEGRFDSRFSWTNSGNAPWGVTTSAAAVGSYSARAGTISNDQSSTLSTTLTTLAGSISFARRVSSETNFDYLIFSIDGTEMGRWSGDELGFTTVSYPVTAGIHTFAWSYTKDISIAAGLDTAFIDNVIFPLAETDVYSLTLAQGQTASIVLEAGLDAGPFQLRNAAGTLLATSAAGATNVDQRLAQFTAAAAGTNRYYIVAPVASPYTLVVTKDADFDAEPNDAFAAAQDLAGAPAVLGQVFPQALDGFETGDLTALGWTPSGNANWFATNTAAASGTFSAQAGDINDSQSSVLSLVRTTGAGNVGFARRVSSESGWDFLRFAIDGTVVGSWSGVETAFTTVSFPVTAGTHAFTWTYVKDSIYSNGLDTAFIDDVSFPGDDDWYSFPVAAGDQIALITSTPGGGSGEFVNPLDPRLELCAPSGGLVASDLNSGGDGRNARIVYTAAETGTYRVHVALQGSAAGEYVLHRIGTPTIVYVDDAWASLAMGAGIADADPVASGDQPAIYGINAFSGVSAGYAFAEALAAVTAGGTILVNAGDYSGQAVNLAKQVVLTLQEDASGFGSLAGISSATVNLAGVTLTVGANGADTQFAGALAGTGDLTKIGGGWLTLAGSSTCTGTIAVNGGRLLVDGAVPGVIAVGAAGTLGGTGTTGPVTVAGTLSPGGSPGVLDVGNLVLLDGSALNIEIGGATPGDGNGFFDQLRVTGTATIGAGVTLNLTSHGGFVPSMGQGFLVLDNDGASDGYGSPFAGLVHGAMILDFLGSGLPATIRYTGGNGNDVLVQVTSPPVGLSVAPAAINENELPGTLVGSLAAVDPDLPFDSHTYALASDGSDDNASFNLVGSQLYALESFDREARGSYRVHVRTTDASLFTHDDDLTITVGDVNEAPALAAAAWSVDENTAAVTTVAATDPDLPSQTITYTLTGGVDRNLFNLTAAGVLTFKAAPNFEAPADADRDNVYLLQITARDPSGLTAVQSFSVEVKDVNENPAITTPAAFRMAENIADVGLLSAADPDRPAQPLAFSIAGGADGDKFEVSPGGQLRFKSAPNFESPADANRDNRYQVTVAVADGSGGGGVQSITVTIDDANDAPVLSGTVDFPTITEDDVEGSRMMVSALIEGRVVDEDAGAVEGIAIVEGTGEGRWQFSLDQAWSWNDMNVSADNALLLRPTDLVRFLPGRQIATVAGLTFRAWDRTEGAFGETIGAAVNGGASALSSQTATASAQVLSVNDAPLLYGTWNLPAITEEQPDNEGAPVADLVQSTIGDPDPGALRGIAIHGTNVNYGVWQYKLALGGGWLPVGTVTHAASLLLRDTDRVRFVPDGSNGAMSSIFYHAWDRTQGAAGDRVSTAARGGTTAFSTAEARATIAVAPVNDAPVLNSANNFAPINEDATNNPGSTAYGILWSRYLDCDRGAARGIAITGLTRGNGRWEYSLDSGAHWTDVGAVAPTAALLLRADDRVRFRPDGANGTTSASISLRAWDQTSGAAGQYANATIDGGTTAFSTASAVSSIAVQSINDAPVLSGANPLASIDEDATNNAGGLVATSIANRIGDVDSGARQGIAVYAVAGANGTWQYYGAAGWTDIGAVSNSAALLLGSTDKVRFRPNGVSGTTASLSFRAWDQTRELRWSKVSVASYGGSTPFSAAVASSQIVVRSLNDAPVLSGANNFATISSTPTQNNGQAVSTLIQGKVADGDSTLIGIAITGLNGSSGRWEYSLDGRTWRQVGAVSATGALLLRATDRLRFVPAPGRAATASISFRAWDRSWETVGHYVDTTRNGGTTAFSQSIRSSFITVRV